MQASFCSISASFSVPMSSLGDGGCGEGRGEGGGGWSVVVVVYVRKEGGDDVCGRFLVKGEKGICGWCGLVVVALSVGKVVSWCKDGLAVVAWW